MLMDGEWRVECLFVTPHLRPAISQSVFRTTVAQRRMNFQRRARVNALNLDQGLRNLSSAT